MEAQATGNKLHPVLWAAAVAVIILSTAGVAAIFGVIPPSGSAQKPDDSLSAVAPAQAPAPAATASAKLAEPVPPSTQASSGNQPAAAKKVAAVKPESKPVEKIETRPAPAAVPPAPVAAAAPCTHCGTIESIVEKTQKGEGTGIGAVAGGVAGAVLGSQVGRGGGKTAATVLGAAGGAVAGHQAERYIRKTAKWEVVVRFEDGTAREFDFASPPAWRMGDKVKVDNGVIVTR